MDIFVTTLLLFAGLFLILKGGDLFVMSSSSIARIAHIKEIIIGATIVSIGTTLPEFLTSLIATMRGVSMGGDTGYFEIASSNAIGSMLANTGLILAIVFLVRPPQFERSTFDKRGVYVVLISVLVTLFMSTGGRVSVVEGVILLLLFVIFMTMNIFDAIKSQGDDENMHDMMSQHKDESLAHIIVYFVLGAVGIGVGAMLLVDNARALALSVGVSEQLVGVTIVAVGTSLPELVTAVTSLRRGSTDIGVGNILGAHMINATLIIGIIAVVARGGLYIDEVTRGISCIVLVLIMSILVVPAIINRRFSRWQGVIMLSIYLAYIGYNVYMVTA